MLLLPWNSAWTIMSSPCFIEKNKKNHKIKKKQTNKKQYSIIALNVLFITK